MGERYDFFILLAEMRTGSNFLETNLNALDGVACHGEAFNSAFIGYPDCTSILGVTQDMRDADPHRLLDALRGADGQLAGFRYFHDHDPRVLDACLDDDRCAKIILTRNPVDAYVSWKIARSTDQWKLTQVRNRKSTKVNFDGAEFAARTETLKAFQLTVATRLQRSGQTAFYLDYEDLRDIEVINGLAKFLGVPSRLTSLDMSLKAQNPEPVTDKVTNPHEMGAALAEFDSFSLSRTPSFEPRRGPSVPSYVAAAKAPVMYLPIPGGPHEEVETWLGALDGQPTDALLRGLSRKHLRSWRQTHKPHRLFTVIRHPLARAHSVYCARVLARGDDDNSRIRAMLARNFDLAVPEDGVGPEWSQDAHRGGFDAFLRFIKANLNGQTPQRVESDWASQVELLRGFSEVAPPDNVMREDTLQSELDGLSSALGLAPVTLKASSQDAPFTLEQIYDDDLEKIAQATYPRDYLAFGFGAWR